MSQKPVPIIIVGKDEGIGRGAIEALKPDYEGDEKNLLPVVHPSNSP